MAYTALTTYSSLSPISAAIFARLNVQSLKGSYPATGAGCVGGVRDYVPQPATFPMLFFEVSESDLGGLGTGPTVKRVQLRLHVFSQYLGASENQRIITEAIRLLQHVEPTVTGWQVPAIGRPNDLVPIELSELNGVAVRELVAIFDDIFAGENAA